MALNGGEVNFKSLKTLIPRCSLTLVKKMSRSVSNKGSITAITYIFINNIKLQSIGYFIFKFKKALNIEIIIINYI